MALVCGSLYEVRGQIDAINRQIVALLAERGAYVKQAARFKRDLHDVKAPSRVEQVIAKVRALSKDLGADADLTEKVCRAMIAAFIDQEIVEKLAIDELRD